MRVLVITNMYPPHHYGGYELLCQEMVDGFRAAGHEVLVLTSNISVPGVEDRPEPRTLVRRDLRLYWRDHVMLRPSRRESLDIERTNQRALADAISTFQPTVVSVGHMGALSIGLLRSCQKRHLPVVGVINDDWLVYAPRVDRWADTWRRAGPLAAVAERAFGVPCRIPDLGAIATYCFISETTRQTAEHAGGRRFTDATVGYSGINVEDFPGRRSATAEWGRWRLLYVGRIDERKGIHTAIRALAHLPTSCTLDIVGRGDDRYLLVCTPSWPSLVSPIVCPSGTRSVSTSRRATRRQTRSCSLRTGRSPSVWSLEGDGLLDTSGCDRYRRHRRVPHRRGQLPHRAGRRRRDRRRGAPAGRRCGAPVPGSSGLARDRRVDDARWVELLEQWHLPRVRAPGGTPTPPESRLDVLQRKSRREPRTESDGSDRPAGRSRGRSSGAGSNRGSGRSAIRETVRRNVLRHDRVRPDERVRADPGTDDRTFCHYGHIVFDDDRTEVVALLEQRRRRITKTVIAVDDQQRLSEMAALAYRDRCRALQ